MGKRHELACRVPAHVGETCQHAGNIRIIGARTGRAALLDIL
jgi:hypothetical protein